MTKKIYFSEGLLFDPKRVWVVLASSATQKREVWSMHRTEGEADKAAIALRRDQSGVDVEITQGVLMPNFNVSK